MSTGDVLFGTFLWKQGAQRDVINGKIKMNKMEDLEYII